MKTLPLQATAVLLLAGVVLCTDVRAQMVPINAGDRIRVRLATPDSGPERYANRQELRGDVTAISAEDVALRVHPDASPLTIPFSAIERLDVSRGVRSRSHNALVWGSRSAAVWGATWYFENSIRDSPLVREDWKAALIGAGIGAATGALLGALRREERWRRVRLPQ